MAQDQGLTWALAIRNEQMEATAKMMAALNAQRKVNGMMEEAARQDRQQSRQTRGR